MNERIRQIAEQVYGSAATEQEIKFAELIVRECMGVAKGMRNPPNLNYKPSDRFVDELRLHFGVKE
jgi:hypothetical protein